MKTNIRLISCLITLSPLLGNPPSDYTLAAGGTAPPAQDGQSKQQVSDLRIIPGTRWMAAIVTEPDGFRFCTIKITEKDGEIVGFTVGSGGTLALLVEDIYLECQVSSVMPWAEEGQSYRAILFLADKKFNVSAVRMGEHVLLVTLGSIDTKALLQTKRIALAVGSIAMRGYNVEGLGIAVPESGHTAELGDT